MIDIYTLTSTLHDARELDRSSATFLNEVFPDGDYRLAGNDFSAFRGDPDLIFVRTGGTEGLFLEVIPDLVNRGIRRYTLLTSGSNNSLAASMEILSFLGKVGLEGEILHGSAAYIRGRVDTIEKVSKARKALQGLRLGVLGMPSDWLIASDVDQQAVQDQLGIELIGIPMDKVKAVIREASAGTAPVAAKTIEAAAPAVRDAVPGALQIHEGIKSIVKNSRLDGFTLRCFDLLKEFGNTGCLSLAAFNAEGIPAACEGDIPALLTMTIAKVVCGHTGFMANPSRIDPETGEAVFAHCTIPFDIIDGVSLDSHFESGIGVGIKGHFPEQDITIFKVSGDLSQAFIAEGRILRNLDEKNLCRTQIVVRLDEPELARKYFLSRPVGNHHIIIPGRWKDVLEAVLPHQHHCCGGGHHGGGHHGCGRHH